MSEQLRMGLLVSTGVHLVLLVGAGGVAMHESDGAGNVRIDLATLDAVTVAPEGALSIGAMTGAGDEESKAVEKRRMLYQRYIEEVSDEIHAHRLDSGRSDLIGIAAVAFRADAAGIFHGIVLRKSSGNPELDEASLRAVRASSGKVKRPKELGTGDITVVEEVRFQYGLR
ncbi:energy transducer TonB [Sutterella sp.]|uniref:energy transducer TonB family protein n=1 Tax=Sutterella sp. TaxID=1981025 RepID=UPI0026DEA253|nr:energy transducer TonB [Sutterella sp.]MDO5532623.1 energy transducer TonB [Sutterella sp.]